MASGHLCCTAADIHSNIKQLKSNVFMEVSRFDCLSYATSAALCSFELILT